MQRPKCKLCFRRLEHGIHAAIRYHTGMNGAPNCKLLIRRKQKRECWHRHKEDYRVTSVVVPKVSSLKPQTASVPKVLIDLDLDSVVYYGAETAQKVSKRRR